MKDPERHRYLTSLVHNNVYPSIQHAERDLHGDLGRITEGWRCGATGSISRDQHECSCDHVLCDLGEVVSVSPGKPVRSMTYTGVYEDDIKLELWLGDAFISWISSVRQLAYLGPRGEEHTAFLGDVIEQRADWSFRVRP